MAYYVNPNIRDTVRVFPMEGRAAFRRYDMNENPSGLPAAFVEKVKKEITPEFLATYPEPSRFLRKYAVFLGVPFESVTATNGSDMAIRYLFETFGEPGKDVVTVSPTFEMYWVECSILGLHHRPVPYEKDLTVPVEKILASIDGNTRIVVLTNPNNPVGNAYNEAELKRIIEKTKAVGAVLVVDEAYHYFHTGTALELALKEEHVIVLRTFSKLFSIAALRIGIVIGHPALVQYVRQGKLTFDVNSVALLFAERLLEEPGLVDELIRTENEGKAYLYRTLQENGYPVYESEGNFLFIETKRDALTITKELEEEEKILVHGYRNPLLRKFIRVSIGSEDEMRWFMERFLPLDAREES